MTKVLPEIVIILILGLWGVTDSSPSSFLHCCSYTPLYHNTLAWDISLGF